MELRAAQQRETASGNGHMKSSEHTLVILYKCQSQATNDAVWNSIYMIEVGHKLICFTPKFLFINFVHLLDVLAGFDMLL